MRILMKEFLRFAASLITIRLANPDPYVAHIFQWALYGSELNQTLEDQVSSGSTIPEEISIRARDGFGLLEYPLQNGARFDLALVGLRNLLATPEVRGVDISFELSYGIEKAIDAVVNSVEKIWSSSRVHSNLAARNIPSLPLYERLAVRSGMVQLNAFILILSTNSDVKRREVAPWMVRTFSALENAFASIHPASLRFLAPQLYFSIRDVQRVLRKARSMGLYQSSPRSQSVDLSELDHFLRSREYQALVVLMKADTYNNDLNDSDDLMYDLFKSSFVADLIELLARLKFGSSSHSAIRNILLHFNDLAKQGDPVSLSLGISELRLAMARIFDLCSTLTYDCRLAREAVRAEFYSNLVLFSSHILRPMHRLRDAFPDITRGTETCEAVQHFFGTLMKKIHVHNVNESWLFHGDIEIRKSWTLAAVELSRISRLGVAEETLTDVLTAFKGLESLALKVDNSSL